MPQRGRSEPHAGDAPSRATVIGRGEVGRRLGDALTRAGWRLTYASRTEGWPAALVAAGTPRLLAMREDDLVPAFQRFPDVQRRDLVLVQNGFLEAGLPAADLEPVTRALIWFTAKGDFFLPLRTSIIHGPWAEALSHAWNHAGLPFDALHDREGFLREMIVKGFWNTIVGLPLAVHQVDLGTYLGGDHADEIEALAQECCQVCAAVYGVEVLPIEAIETLMETTEQLGWVRTSSARALEWRNGAIARWGQEHGIPTPVTADLLARA